MPGRRIKVLSVAEKPSVAKQLAIVMNNGQPPPRRNGPSPFNTNWKVKTKILGREECDMVVTSVTGHMMDLRFGPEYKSWRIDESVLFQAPVHKQVRACALGSTQAEIMIDSQCCAIQRVKVCPLGRGYTSTPR